MTQIPRMLLLLLVLCIVSRIATAPPEFKPDFYLLQPPSDREHQSLGEIFLSLREYRCGQTRVVFTGASHTSRLDSLTNAMIESLIRKFHADYVVIKEFEAKKGTPPPCHSEKLSV